MNKIYTIIFYGYITANSYVELIDKLHQFKVNVSKMLNAEAEISYDVYDEIFEFNNDGEYHWASFPVKISQMTDLSNMSQLIDCIKNGEFANGINKEEEPCYFEYDLYESK